MALVKEVNGEPIPGYRLLEPLGRGGFGEVWKCEAPGGIFKAIKFVYGDLNGLDADSARPEEELRAFQHVKALRHPFLLSLERVESIGGELIIVTELADTNLQEVLTQYRQAGQAGIPRTELLGYLLEAAEVLDLMNVRHGLQHLDIKPGNLFLVSQHVKVADFGLVNSLSESKRIHLGAITPLYASPELFLGRFSRHSDQYSLAIVFQELLTGSLPFPGQNCRQLLFQHTKQEPELGRLPQTDRPIVARALAKDPEKRFPSCLDFVRALCGSNPTVVAAAAGPRQLADPPEPGPQPGPAGAPPADTVSQPIFETQMMLGSNSSSSPGEVLPGYQFLECLGHNPLMDLWKVQSAKGRVRWLKFIYGLAQANTQGTTAALAWLQSLHHPALVPVEVAQVDPGRLAVLTNPVQKTLRDRAQECHAAQLPGIPRDELLGYLRATAEALDNLFGQHSLQHLGLNPRTLVLNDDRLQISDFGLAQLLWLPAGQPIAQHNCRYAAPELFDHMVSPSSDQFSLAVIYHELLTGQHPGHGGRRNHGRLDLSRLPEQDQEVLARALDPDPHRRWPSCRALVRALEGRREDPDGAGQKRGNPFDAMLKGAAHAALPLPAGAALDNLDQLLQDLLATAGAKEEAAQKPAAPLLWESEDVLRHTFTAGLPLGSARLKLESFAQQWSAQLLREDEQGCVFHVELPSNFWQQWLGRPPGLEVKVKLTRVHPLSATPIEVAVQVWPCRCGKKRSLQLLQEKGAQILDSLRVHLLVNSKKRLQERLHWPHLVRVRLLHADGQPGEEIECRGKDISLSGIGFYLPRELPTSEILLALPSAPRPCGLSIPATLVRAKPCPDGGYEVGAMFRLPALRPARALSLAQS